ncbi:MAG: hypothetical protein IJ379_07455 [Lachnospiraceae bacterium]|nr:hypothetical protein [Lachnospiraceae bacterium]
MKLNRKLWAVVGLLIMLELVALFIVLKINSGKQKQIEEELAALRGEERIENSVEGTSGTSEEDDITPWYFTPYNGYMDECTHWLYYDRFVDKDYDGDGKADRVYREEVLGTKINEESKYRIELSGGQTLLVEKMSNGLPKVESYDFDKDGEREILFTCSFDFNTKADYIGLDIVLFDKVDGVYERLDLPFEKDKNKYFIEFTCEEFTPEDISIGYQLPGLEKKGSLIPSTDERKQYIGEMVKGRVCGITMLDGSLLFRFAPFEEDMGKLATEASYENGEWSILGYSYSY